MELLHLVKVIPGVATQVRGDAQGVDDLLQMVVPDRGSVGDGTGGGEIHSAETERHTAPEQAGFQALQRTVVLQEHREGRGNEHAGDKVREHMAVRPDEAVLPVKVGGSGGHEQDGHGARGILTPPEGQHIIGTQREGRPQPERQHQRSFIEGHSFHVAGADVERIDEVGENIGGTLTPEHPAEHKAGRE